MPNQGGIILPAATAQATYPLVNAVDLLAGFATAAATQVATTFMTIPANRTWSGTVSLNCATAEAAAGAVQGQATGVVTIAGGTATPAAGTILRCSAYAGANAATGLVGSSSANNTSQQVTVVAGTSAATLQLTTTQAGTTSEVNVSAFGQLQ